METLTDKGPRQMFCSTNSKRQQMPDQTITSSRTFNHSRFKKTSKIKPILNNICLQICSTEGISVKILI